MRARGASPIKEDKTMKKILAVGLSIAFALTVAVAQNTNSSTTATNSPSDVAKARKPVFRASKDQIKQVQGLLKQRGFYSGEETGKLDDDTRAGLRKYQEAEKIKVTGTLNKMTLQKMGVVLTDKQKTM
jgi:peptidoglycan hydrolase-like protein with peptidoglycan-binding domain